MPPLHLRRATVDDLGALQSLWSAMQLPVAELESRLTEFQVVESGGELTGAIGVQFLRSHARLHSEGYLDYSVADAARELFWDRVQTLAANHGVFRVWTQENSPFWAHWGFQPADQELLGRLPDEWKALPGRWLTLELKNEAAIQSALEHRLPEFHASEKISTDRTLEQARKLRLFITIAGFAIFFLCLVVLFFLLRHHPLTAQ